MNKYRKNRIIYTTLLLVCVVLFWMFDNFYTPAPYSLPEGEGYRTEIPKWLWPSSSTGEIVQHAHFALSYNEAYEQAEWVAYVLEKSHLTKDDRKRPLFLEDPKVRTKSADWRNYRGSGYDRGHLCPAGDRRFSEYAYNETFYTSNIAPQDREFNAGIWNRLEQQVRYWAKREGPLFVVTAGVLEGGLSSIGEEDVAVPKYFYKIIAQGKGENLKIIGFLFPNQEDEERLDHFVVPVDRIEKLTGIDFFSGLPDEQEAILEASLSTSGWRF
ncbi:DNA/RNA non-specific endonuclease [Arenibacter sp. F20364]|uniref:DNA/RNA non-specific endonuclease n=1 Tax=Arenibacter sp. F20364 TaxID=2926415 RepID=UPI001FF3FFA4|nr:DNA/RNA non-specific endonuclease [Arenibacter sp. F20364]MCK0191011.1 DNA/RNA non-specific endonuclease [Arenibacter sp. F20364]